jgi:hypothetical protein
MPILGKIKMHLRNDDMLSKNSLEKDEKEFYSAYGTNFFAIHSDYIRNNLYEIAARI